MNGLDQAAQTLLQPSLWDNLAPPVQMALLTGSLVLLPAALASLTCFTRVSIVLSFIRRGMSTQEIPPTPVLLGLSLFLTFFIMAPTFERIADDAVLPYLNDEISGITALHLGTSIQKDFMLRQTRKRDLALFLHLAKD